MLSRKKTRYYLQVGMIAAGLLVAWAAIPCQFIDGQDLIGGNCPGLCAVAYTCPELMVEKGGGGVSECDTSRQYSECSEGEPGEYCGTILDNPCGSNYGCNTLGSDDGCSNSC